MNITKKQLYWICHNYKFIILRYNDNTVMAINCKIAKLKQFDKVMNDNSETAFISWRTCEFSEYIHFKEGFL